VFSFVTYMIYYPLVLAILILNCFADAPPRFSEYPSVEVSEEVDHLCHWHAFEIYYVCKIFDNHSLDMIC
jgi:hypothetical protein